MSIDLKVTSQHWSEHTTRFSGRNSGLFWWEVGPALHRRINRKISGNPEVDWILYTLVKYFDGRLPLARCLSLGCGNGHLERNLARLHAFEQCDAYDVAEGSVQEARRLATAEGFSNVTYCVADANDLTLPQELYDAVWIHSAMHHFEALEHISQQIKQALKPEGILVLNEYIGPSRFQFPARQKDIANACLLLLPNRYRTIIQERIELETERTPFKMGAKWFVSRLADKVKDRDFVGSVQRRLRVYKAKTTKQVPVKTAIAFPSARDVVAADPSEAIRSDEIVKVLQRDFEIVEKRGYGGNLLQFLLEGIAGNFATDDPDSQAVLKMLFNIEDTLLQCGEFESDFAYIACRPLTS